MISTFSLTLQWHGAKSTQIKVLDIINNIMTLLFILEFIIKFIGIGLNYFKNPWNIIDFICTVFSAVDFIVQQLSGSKVISAFKIVRIFRIFRSFRVIKRLRT